MSERWRQIEELYHRALELGPHERGAFLERACGTDLSLRRQVESLLVSETGGSSFLEHTPLSQLAVGLSGENPSAIEGRRIGSYTILSKLGAGGMGEVYRARDPKLSRDVAIKVMAPSLALNPAFVRRLEREARLLAAINHPNIAAIYDLQQDAGNHFLVLELVEGNTLADVLKKGGALPIEEALIIAEQICRALEAAHEKGIVHRDLKPANVKILPDGRVKVLDFGLAKTLAEDGVSLSGSPTISADLSEKGAIFGTPAYMSPEQAQGKAIDARTDVFAFGALVYEMIAGRPAFQRDSVIATLAAVLGEQPAALESVRPDLPAELVRVVRRCIRKEPGRRFQTMADLRVALQDALEEFQSTGVQAPSPAAGAGKRRVGRWLIPVLAVVPIAAGIIMFLERQPNARRPTFTTPLFTRMTADEGFTADPAISPDGTLIAYTSDRGGNLDIWVQQIAGATPLQLTRDDFDEREPAFNPDGSRIVFRSERNGGGLYTVSTFGGEQPRLLAPQGRRPLFSPDGQRVAYWTGTFIGFSVSPHSYRTFVVPAEGGAPQELPGMTGARFPVWSPDGRSLLVLGSQDKSPTASTYDWWLVPLDGTAPIKTGVVDRLRSLGVDLATLSVGPDAWWDGRVYFSDLNNLWSIPVDQSNGKIGEPEQLTLGTSQDIEPVLSRSGLIAFTALETSNNIWSLPLDSNHGRVTGAARKLTRGIGRNARASMSKDGATIAYVSNLTRQSLLVGDVRSGKMTDLGVNASNFGPALSPDGGTVAYEYNGGPRPSEVAGVRIVSSSGGESRVLCEGCQIGEWSAGGRSLFGVFASPNSSSLALISVDTLTRRDVVTSARYVLNRPELNPSNRLLAFRATADSRDSLFVVPLRPDRTLSEDEWIRVVAPEEDARPCGWSEDGTLIYILSSRDGTRCLYAQRVDAETGRPIGAPIEVQHFHGIRNYRTGAAGVISTGPSNAVVAGAFLFDYATYTANIWTMKVTR